MNRDKLIAAGVNYDEGVNRFGGVKELFEKYLLMFFDERLIDKIEKEMDENNFVSAASTVHALKGESGNLSVTKLYENTCILMELLRNNPAPDKEKAMQLLSVIKTMFNDAEIAAKE